MSPADFLMGPGAHDSGAAILRLAVGGFFAISGYYKLTREKTHARLLSTLIEDKIPFPRFNVWFVPGVEFIAGLALAIGFFSLAATFLLGVVCVVATCSDGWRRMWEKYHPETIADVMDDLLYLPEVLLALMLLSIALSGPGIFSLDYWLFVARKGLNQCSCPILTTPPTNSPPGPSPSSR